MLYLIVSWFLGALSLMIVAHVVPGFVTFGFFLFVINALILRMVSGLVGGFTVETFGAALIGAIVLALVSTILRHLVFV